MTFQPGAMVYTQGFGSRPENIEVPFLSNRPPAATDVNFPLGKRWVYIGDSEWVLVALTSTGGVLTADWVQNSSSSGNVISVTGTANEITATDTLGNIVLSIPATFIAPGSIASTTTITAGTGLTVTTGNATVSTGNITATLGSVTAGTTVTAGTGVTSTTGNIVATAGAVNAGTTMTATLGNITATNGNLAMGTAGNKIIVPTGANASAGLSDAMSGTPGEVVVATTACSATALVFYSRATTGGTPGEVSITAQDGTGFTLTSTANETSTFNWWIINA